MNNSYQKLDSESKAKIGTRGHMLENWVYYVAAVTVCLGGLYSFMSYYGVYGDSTQIYKYFDLAMLVLLITYTNDYAKCNGYSECISTTWIYWGLVVCVLLLLVGYL